MAVADATTSIRIGSFVLDNDFRHPAFVPAEAATRELLSDGRFELGLGAGHLIEDYERTGIAFDPPGVRLGRLMESVRIIKGLFGEEPVSFEGEHYRVSGHQGYPQPLQRPRPPLLIGAGGPRALSFAAQEADIVAIVVPALRAGGLDIGGMPYDYVARQVAVVREAAGERIDQLELNMLIQRVVVSDNRRAAVDELAREWRMEPAVIDRSPHLLIGSVDQIVETLEQRRAQFGLSYVTIFSPSMEEFAPVVARLAGR
jgi:probable F420-dependent oxidoreductase